MNNSAFHFNRFLMVARYYFPALKPQIILYPILASAIQILSFVLMNYEVGMPFAGLMAMILGAMSYFGPLMLSRRSDRVLETMLPASASEKATFIILYCYVAIPAFTIILPFAICQILTYIFGTPDYYHMVIDASGIKDINQHSAIQNLQALVPIATCMYCVVALKKKRYMTVVWCIVSVIALVVIATIGALIAAINSGFIDGVNDGIYGNPPDSEAFKQSFIDILKSTYYVLTSISVIYAALMAWLTARKIKLFQI